MKGTALMKGTTLMCVGGSEMKKLFFGTMLLALVIVVSIPAMAQVSVNVNIGLPPPIAFEAPPDVIVMPDTNSVYVVPGIDVDMFFWNGWWWRPWQGGWYRSRYYNRGWGYYRNVPSFYYDVDPGWRNHYRDHNWYGHPWNYERIPNQRLHQNWQSWHNNRHWEKQKAWGVQGYQPRPPQQRQELRQQRQQQYQQRPEVQQHQQQRQQQQKQPQAQKPRQQPPEKVEQPQKREQRPEAQKPRQQPQEKVQQQQKHEQRPEAQKPRQQPQEKVQQQQHSQPQGKPEGGEGEHRK
jgi:hypothetical protein